MKKIKRFKDFIKLSCTLSLVLFFIGCDTNEDPPAAPQGDLIIEIVNDSDDFDILEAAVVKGNLAERLGGRGPFTVFAPTDAAFEAAGISVTTISNMMAADVESLLRFHVVSGKFDSDDLTSGNLLTLGGESVVVNVDGSNVTVDGVNVTQTDIEASNGVIHIVESVLTPPPPGLTEAATEEGLTVLLSALAAAQLDGALASGDGLTIFAPTNDAFTAFLDAIGQSSLDDIPASVLAEVLNYHVVDASGGALASTDLAPTQTVTTLSGEDVVITVDNGTVALNPDTDNAVVGTADVQTLSGFVHVIDKVLVPPSITPILGTIVAPAYFNKDFTTLIAAVNAADEANPEADILETLLSNGPSDAGLTLFAPTNQAFADAGITNLDNVSDILVDVLTYHLIDGTFESTDVLALDPAQTATVNGKEVFFSAVGDDNDLFINGNSQVITPDITGSNGIVHVIDRALLPPTKSITEIVTETADGGDGEFTILLDLIGKAANLNSGTSLADYLSDASNEVTVFAPTDQAFDNVKETLLNTLTPVQIRDILLYHVVDDAVFSTDLSDGAVTTLNGADITINATDLTITDENDGTAGIIPTVNILATNGVIHTIDEVLLPQL